MKKGRKSFFFFFAIIFVVWVITIIIALKYPFGKEEEKEEFDFSTDKKIVDLDVTGYGIYVGGEKIGYTISRKEETESGVRISEKSFMNISAYGTNKEVTTYTVSEADEDLALKTFYFELSGEHPVRTNGKIKNDSIYLTIETAGEKKNRVLSIGNKPFVPASIERVAQELKLQKDSIYNYKIFEPTSEKVVDIKIKKAGKETVILGGKSYETNVVIIDMLGLESRIYIDKDGKMLMETSPMGITMRREPLSSIEDFAKGSASLKIYETYAIYPSGTITTPRESKRLIAMLDGSLGNYKFPVDERQSFDKGRVSINVKEPLADFSINSLDKQKFSKYLESTPFIPCDDEEIKKLSEEITGGGTVEWEGVESIVDWIYKNIKKSPVFSIPYAKEVLKTKVGDCNEHAVLFAALVRSIGIPSKVVVGIVYVDGAFYYHAWNEVYWGRWVACDPIFGQYLADATHIKLEEGTLLDFIKVVKLVGRLNIRIIESS
jgi:hypothetical protein